MSIKINLGVSKKIGLPDYGSLGASCHLEIEVDGSKLENHLDRFHEQVQQAYVACTQAVNDELARQASGSASSSGRGNTSGSKQPAGGTHRAATQSQVRALQAIAQRNGYDLCTALQRRFGVAEPAQLSISDASRLIDELKDNLKGVKRAG